MLGTVLHVFRSTQLLLLATVGLAAATFCLNLFYNLFLHPLRKFPGPKLWAASRVPWCWYQYQGILPKKILELHIKYGHTVRVAPTELSYTSSTAWKDVYGQRAVEMGKDPIFSLLTPTGAQNIMVADRETHSRQRRLLAHAFSERALREQEGILNGYVERLMGQLAERSAAGPVDLVAWFNFTTFDLIGDLSFGENMGCLDRADYVPFVAAIRAMASELTFTQMWKYWNLIALKFYLTPKEALGQRMKNMKWAMATVGRRMNRETSHKDFLHYILAANDEKGMSPAEIHVNAFSLNIAGSESTATTLCGICFLVLSHPAVYRRLRAEIRDNFKGIEEIDLASCGTLEYMEAVIAETLRLYPPVAITMPRRTPPTGDMIDGVFVAGNTTVGVNHYACSRMPLNFHQPNDFLPERWLSENEANSPFAGDDRASSQPFSFGPRGCLGKNLAKAEVRLVFSKLLFLFDLELVPGQDDWRSGQRIQGFWQKPPLQCVLRPRVS